MAERDESTPVPSSTPKPVETAPGDVLEEHALDRIAGAELEHLLESGLDQRLPTFCVSLPVHARCRSVRAEPGRTYAEGNTARSTAARRPAASQVHRRDLPR